MKLIKFTLIEVVIATLILALSATVAVEMTSSAQLRSYNAESEWSKEHLLSLGCEFYLLFGHEAERPDFLPPGYEIKCSIDEGLIPEGEEELEKYDPSSGWVIGEYTIKLFKEGNEIATISIDKLVPADLFE
jgi:hypothetical protein